MYCVNFPRRRRKGESAAGAGQQSPEPGAGGGEKLAGRHGADPEDDGEAERPLPRPPLQELQHPDGHRQRDAGRPEKSESTLTVWSLSQRPAVWRHLVADETSGSFSSELCTSATM